MLCVCIRFYVAGMRLKPQLMQWWSSSPVIFFPKLSFCLHLPLQLYLLLVCTTYVDTSVVFIKHGSAQRLRWQQPIHYANFSNSLAIDKITHCISIIMDDLRQFEWYGRFKNKSKAKRNENCVNDWGRKIDIRTKRIDSYSEILRIWFSRWKFSK